MINDKLSEHLTGLASEVQNLMQKIPMDGIDPEMIEHINSAKNALNFSNGETLEQKRNKLNSTLDAISNYRRSI